MPFKGEWYVAWGGRKINENQHTVSQAQRFAYDFLIRKGCKTFKRTGKANSDYYCYNQVVISPGPGKIVEIINEVEENIHGQMPKIHGNRIVIDHKNGEGLPIKFQSYFSNGEFIKVGEPKIGEKVKNHIL